MSTKGRFINVKNFFMVLTIILCFFMVETKAHASYSGSPEVNIIAPGNMEILSQAGSMVSISAQAIDSDGISKLEYYVDGKKIGETDNMSSTLVWESTAGLHNLEVKAYDTLGKLGISNKVAVQVPTTVDITSPANGSTVKGVINTFNITTEDPISWYALYVDGVLRTSNYLGESTISSLNIPFIWDTTTLQSGSVHQVEIITDTVDGVTSVGKSTVKVDNDKPIVNIVDPVNNSTVVDLVYLNVQATDLSEIDKVEFFVDGVKIGETKSQPYSYAWQSTVGRHTIQAKATDIVGNVGESSTISVNVQAKITITSPLDGSSLGGIINKVEANFSAPLTGPIRLFIDGVFVQQVGGPFQVVSNVSFQHVWDTNQYENGTIHVIDVNGYTETGSIYSKGRSTVITDNTIDVTAPVVQITAPTDRAFLAAPGQLVELQASASDKVGVSKVEFYVDGIKIGESATAPFKCDWISTDGGHTILAKAYDEAGNFGTSSILVGVPAKITINNPISGSAVKGTISSFSATFSSPVKGYYYLHIDGVRVQQCGSPFWTESEVNFQYTWDTNQYENGSTHTIEIRGGTNVGFTDILTIGKSVVIVDNSTDVTAP